MKLDYSYFEQMEAKIPHGKVRTRFAPSPALTAAPSSCALRTPTRTVRWRVRWM